MIIHFGGGFFRITDNATVRQDKGQTGAGFFPQGYAQAFQRIDISGDESLSCLIDDQLSLRLKTPTGFFAMEIIQSSGEEPGDRYQCDQDDHQERWVYLPYKTFTGHRGQL